MDAGIIHSGIVSAFDYQDWHVREAIEYVKKDNKELIEQLECEGFFRLYPNEADPAEVNIAAVEDGSIIVMGRQVLALKHFAGPDEDEETDETSQGLSAGIVLDSKAKLSSMSEGPAAAKTSNAAAGIPPMVTNAATEQSPPRKKPKSVPESMNYD